MTAPTAPVTNRERQVWWWVAAAAPVVVAVMAIIWIVGRSDDTVARVEPSPSVTAAPTAAVRPTPSTASTPEPTAGPTAEPSTTTEPEPETPPDRTPEREPPEPQPEPGTSPLLGVTYGPFSGGSTPPVGGSWIADVRSAGHAGYDRVVVEFDGAVVPTYTVAYTATSGPFYDVPGNIVTIEGVAFLDVWLQGTSRVDMTEKYTPVYTGPTRLRSDTTTVTEVVEVEDFEANVHWLIGLDERAEFVVWTLHSPSRLVIDIAA